MNCTAKKLISRFAFRHREILADRMEMRTCDTDCRYRANAAGAQTSRTATLLDIEVLRLRIARQVKEQVAFYHQSQRELETAEQNLSSAQKRLRLASRLFEKGRMDNFSVTDAETAYLDAEDSRFAAEAEASVPLQRWRRRGFRS